MIAADAGTLAGLTLGVFACFCGSEVALAKAVVCLTDPRAATVAQLSPAGDGFAGICETGGELLAPFNGFFFFLHLFGLLDESSCCCVGKIIVPDSETIFREGPFWVVI